MLLLLTLLTIPFIQLGLSFWVSGAQLAGVLVILQWGRGLMITAMNNLWVLLPVPFLFISLIWARTGNFEGEALRIAREALMFVILTVALLWTAKPNFSVRPGKIEKHISFMAMAFLLLAMIQMYFYSRGMYFGLPRQWFVINSDTLAGAMDLYYNDIRPNGPYGEPSYFGFVLLSLMVAVTPALKSSRWAQLAYGAALIAGILSRSLAFLLAAALVAGIPMFMRATFKARLQIVALALLALFPVLMLTPALDVLGRLLAGSSQLGDYSIYVRIVAPVKIVPEFIAAYPFGVPAHSLDIETSSINLGNLRWEEILHNGFINAIFTYGVFGVILFLCIIRAAGNLQITMYLMASTMFNGAFFYIDKISILILTVVIYRSRMTQLSAVNTTALPRHGAQGTEGRRRLRPARTFP